MKFENSKSDGGSYERPKPGKYIGVLVGFCFVGTQPGGQFGPKPKVMLRWELHKRKGPALDSSGYPFTITQSFGATVRGDQSRLKACLVAHGVDVPEGTEVDSRDWLGRAAWLDVVENQVGEKTYANIEGISRLDPDDDEVPSPIIDREHWEGPDDGKYPSWADWAIRKSQEFAGLAPEKKHAGVNGSAVGAGVAAGGQRDDDIPF